MTDIIWKPLLAYTTTKLVEYKILQHIFPCHVVKNELKVCLYLVTSEQRALCFDNCSNLQTSANSLFYFP